MSTDRRRSGYLNDSGLLSRRWRALALLFAVWLLSGGAATAQANTVCDETSGRTERHDFYAAIIQTRLYYTVYLPPCYDSSAARYPVLYLLHGSNEDDGQWLRLGLADILDAGIAAGELPPMIVVMPFGEWIANENRFGDASWGGIFLNQLMPLVEEQYRVNPNRATRAIGGISRGGFWAFHIALRNPVLFGSVGGHSAFFDPYHAPPEYNPLHLARDAFGVESVRIWLDRGRDDFAAPGLDLMHEWLSERGVDHIYQVYPEGQHYLTYWRQHVRTYLDFYAEPWLAHEPGATPTEAPPEPAATPAADDIESAGYELYLPVVAFPSRNANIDSVRLGAIAAGEADRSLVLAENVAERLRQQGVVLAEQTRIVPAEALYNTLWRDRTLFTLLPFDRLQPRYRVLNVDELHPLDHDLADYPFAFASSTPNYQPERLTRLLMSGVTALTRATIPALDANGVEWAASGIRDYVSRADFFHTSNEVSFVPDCPQGGTERLGGPTSFCSKPEHFELFPLLGLDIVELSGNHNNDYGYDAYRETLRWYAERGIMTVGGGETLAEARRPLLLEHNGNRVALVACNWVGPYYALVNEDLSLLGGVRPGAAFCDLDWLRELLPRLSAEYDLVVVTVQYFEFDEYTPRQQQRNDFRLLANLGADVVLGTQAHFPQTYEFYAPSAEREAFIHYGLGNLFFDQQFFAGVRFFMDQLFIYDGRLLAVDVFTGIIEGQGRPRPMTPDERENFLFLMFNQYGDF